MKTADFDYFLPQELIAQTPAEPRDHSRLLVYHRSDGSLEHRHFYDIIDYLRPGDALVINETRVIPARLLGVKEDTGVPVEVLLLRRHNATDWEALVRPGRRLKPGTVCSFGDGLLRCEILGNVEETGGRTVRFSCDGIFEEVLDRLGEMPLPPYIHEKLQDPGRYQTVYARQEGSAAAPTAGLHFTPEILAAIEAKGVKRVAVTLHVGPGTFRPVKAENIEDHHMDFEAFTVPPETAEAINACKAQGGRVFCVGSTTVRTLESVAASMDDGSSASESQPKEVVRAGSGASDIFIYPPYRFRVCDCMLTNFHLPQSTLLMMVSALAGRERILCSYAMAVRNNYMFFSYGDCMLIV